MACCHDGRVRVALCALAGVAVLATSSCSSSAPAEISSAPSITTNGRHYVYAAGSVAKSSWPKVCTLLTTDAAAAALGAAVTATSFHERCYYTPGNDSFPTLTVTILGIGNDKRAAFDEVRDANARYRPTRIDHLGKAAVGHSLTGSPTVNLDLLAAQGLFELALRSPVGNETSSAEARSILTKVATALAKEF